MSDSKNVQTYSVDFTDLPLHDPTEPFGPNSVYVAGFYQTDVNGNPVYDIQGAKHIISGGQGPVIGGASDVSFFSPLNEACYDVSVQAVATNGPYNSNLREPISIDIAQSGRFDATGCSVSDSTSGPYPGRVYVPYNAPLILVHCAKPITDLEINAEEAAFTVPGSSKSLWNYVSRVAFECRPSGNSPTVELTIDKMRTAQTVFNPTATGYPGISIVTNKKFAVELSLSAVVPSGAGDLQAYAELFLDDQQIGQSPSFKLSQIKSGISKVFVYGITQLTGAHQITAKIVPQTSVTGLFDSSNSPSNTTSATFYKTSLSILTGEIVGCLVPIGCFKPPTNPYDEDHFQSEQEVVAKDLLPISGGPTYQKGRNITDSTPVPFFGVTGLLDFLELYRLKKDAKTNSAVYLVDHSYMDKHGIDSPGGGINRGVTIRALKVSVVDANEEITLTHELLHSIANRGDSSVLSGEGFIAETGHAFTSGEALDSTTDIISTTGPNIFDPPARAFDEDSVIDNDTYAATLSALVHGSIDPSVILVTGAVDSNGSVVVSNFTRMSTLADDQSGT